MAKLRELQVANFKPLDKRKSYEDEDGLRLTVFPQNKGGGKYWEKRYSWQGKVEHLSLGSYPKVSLGLNSFALNNFNLIIQSSLLMFMSLLKWIKTLN